jgi:hypothetical protein
MLLQLTDAGLSLKYSSRIEKPGSKPITQIIEFRVNSTKWYRTFNRGDTG